MARQAAPKIKKGRFGGRETTAALARLASGEAISLPSYTVAQLTGGLAANLNEGRLVYCSNGAAGSPCLAYSNGANWLRITLGAAVSAT